MSLVILQWRDWKSLGLLPRGGDMSQQDALVVAGIRACEEERAEVEARNRRNDEAELERMRREAERRGRRHGP